MMEGHWERGDEEGRRVGDLPIVVTALQQARTRLLEDWRREEPVIESTFPVSKPQHNKTKTPKQARARSHLKFFADCITKVRKEQLGVEESANHLACCLLRRCRVNERQPETRQRQRL